MSNNYNDCSKCGMKFSGKRKRYNPYNITFEYYNFDEKEDDRFCLKCAKDFIEYNNLCLGGVWTLENQKA